MTGYESKKKAAQDKLKCQCSMTTKLVGSGCQYCNPEYLDDDDVQPAQEPEYVLPGGGYVPPIPLTQPEQEPVAWMHVQGNYEEPSFRQLADDEIEMGWKQYPLYTIPPQRPWVGLTDKEIDEWTPEIHGVISAIEAKLKEKNT